MRHWISWISLLAAAAVFGGPAFAEDVGRYTALNNPGQPPMLLDTATGELWKLTHVYNDAERQRIAEAQAQLDELPDGPFGNDEEAYFNALDAKKEAESALGRLKQGGTWMWIHFADGPAP